MSDRLHRVEPHVSNDDQPDVYPTGKVIVVGAAVGAAIGATIGGILIGAINGDSFGGAIASAVIMFVAIVLLAGLGAAVALKAGPINRHTHS